jgi:Flp pilus assembly protein TadG
MKWQTWRDLARCSRGWLRGQTYAEFLMVVLPTLMLIFGIISFGMTVYTYSFLSNAARDAVRYAIVHGSKSTSPASSDAIQTFVRNKAKGLNPSSITVSSCWNPQAPPNQCPGPTGNNAPGKVVSVQVSYSFHPLYPFAKVTLPLSSSAQMVISY